MKITGDHNDGHVVSARTYIGGITAFLRQYGFLKD
jgi:hypothetical protein